MWVYKTLKKFLAKLLQFCTQTLGPKGPSHAEVIGTLEVSIGVVVLGMSALEVLSEVSLNVMGVNPDLSAWPYNLPFT